MSAPLPTVEDLLQDIDKTVAALLLRTYREDAAAVLCGLSRKEFREAVERHHIAPMRETRPGSGGAAVYRVQDLARLQRLLVEEVQDKRTWGEVPT